MSIKKNGARLWFESKSESDAYDDLMISNIELKSDDYENENFAMTSVRSRKEKLPGNHSDKYYNDLAKVEAFNIGRSHIRIGEHGFLKSVSLSIAKNYYLHKGQLNWIAGYFVLREIPLRNFYARSIIMWVYGITYFANYGLPSVFGGMHFPLAFGRSEHDKNRKIYHWLNESDRRTNINPSGKGKFYFLIIQFLNKVYLLFGKSDLY